MAPRCRPPVQVRKSLLGRTHPLRRLHKPGSTAPLIRADVGTVIPRSFNRLGQASEWAHATSDLPNWPPRYVPIPHEASKERGLCARIPGGEAIRPSRWRWFQAGSSPGLARYHHRRRARRTRKPARVRTGGRSVGHVMSYRVFARDCAASLTFSCQKPRADAALNDPFPCRGHRSGLTL
jgi:hypothetical protein